MLKRRNYSAGLCIYCTDRKKMIQGCKNPIARGDFKWIFACNCEGTEQLQSGIWIRLETYGLQTGKRVYGRGGKIRQRSGT